MRETSRPKTNKKNFKKKKKNGVKFFLDKKFHRPKLSAYFHKAIEIPKLLRQLSSSCPSLTRKSMKDEENLQKEIIESIEAGWKLKEKLHQQRHDWSFYLKVLFNLIGPVVFFASLHYHPFSKVMDAQTHQVLALALWMLIWWISEFIPLPATALLPIAILPSFGIVEISDVILPYSSSVIFLFLGGFLIALALEKWGLHP